MTSDMFSDEEIRDIAKAGCAADGCGDGTGDSDAWATRLVIDGSTGFHAGFSEAVRSRAAAILAARKRERLGPWVDCGGWWSRRFDGAINPVYIAARACDNGEWNVNWPDALNRRTGHAGSLQSAMAAADAAARDFYDLDGDEPRVPIGRVVSVGSASGNSGGIVFVSLNSYTAPVWPKHVPITISVAPPQPSALDRLLCADVLRHQPIAIQRAILDVRQAGREVPSALLWRMDLSREPGAAALRAEVIAGRMRARGWKAARE